MKLRILFLAVFVVVSSSVCMEEGNSNNNNNNNNNSRVEHQREFEGYRRNRNSPAHQVGSTEWEQTLPTGAQGKEEEDDFVQDSKKAKTAQHPGQALILPSQLLLVNEIMLKKMESVIGDVAKECKYDYEKIKKTIEALVQASLEKLKKNWLPKEIWNEILTLLINDVATTGNYKEMRATIRSLMPVCTLFYKFTGQKWVQTLFLGLAQRYAQEMQAKEKEHLCLPFVACKNDIDILVDGHMKKNPNFVHQVNVYEETPLSYAASFGATNVMRLLLASGAKINGLLIIAAINNQEEITRQLLDAKADIEATDGQGMPPLICTLKHNLKNKAEGIVRLLLARGANVNARDKDNNTALHYAQTKAMQKLLREHGVTL